MLSGLASCSRRAGGLTMADQQPEQCRGYQPQEDGDDTPRADARLPGRVCLFGRTLLFAGTRGAGSKLGVSHGTGTDIR